MSVIINEFEVDVEPEAHETEASEAAAPVAVQAPAPADVRDVLVQQYERLSRVFAH